MNVKIKRDFEIYKEIESFENYELTQCIVYEMYIRNPIDGIDMQELDSFLNDENSNTTTQDFSNIDGNIKLHNLDEKDGYNILTEIIIDMSYESEKQHTRRAELYDDLGPQIFKEYPYYKNYNTYDINDLKKEYLLKFGGVYNAIKSKSTIIENFKRPKISLNVKEERTSNLKLEIDLNKPIEEIIAYIKHIKNNISNDNNTINAPIELLGIKLQKLDNSDTKTILSKQKKLAHMFYIYDCLKVGMKKSDIINQIFIYSLDTEDDTTKVKQMDNKTLNTYYNIALEYIDNQKYIGLLTGIKPEI